MKVAISVFKDSVSTVFDASQHLLVLEINGAGEQKRAMVKLKTIDPIRRASQLSEEGVNVLICGAISMPMQASISARSIFVYPFVRGARLPWKRTGKRTEQKPRHALSLALKYFNN